MTSLRLQLPAAAGGRVGVLDELKGVAIALVVLYHAGGVLVLEDRLHLEVGVDMFVILSGMGLALSSAGGGPGQFLRRRFLRIYPLYWVVLTALLIGGWCVLGARYYTAFDVFLHYLGIHVLFGDAHALTINDSFWFVTLIVVLYGAYAALWRYRDRPDCMLFFGAVLSVGLAEIYFHTGQSDAFAHFALRIPGFFMGLVAGQLLKAGRVEIPLSAALGCAFLLYFYFPYTEGIIFDSFLVGMALIAAYAFLARPLVPASGRSALKFLGDHSLEIFLIHQPLIRDYNILVLRKVIPGFSPNVPAAFWPLLVGMCVAFLVTLEVSVRLHRLGAWFSAGGRGGPAPASS